MNMMIAVILRVGWRVLMGTGQLMNMMITVILYVLRILMGTGKLMNMDDDTCNLTRNEDSDGYWSIKEYDNNGNLIRHESSGYWETDEYDDNGNLIRHEDSYGYWSTREYDNNGNLIRFDKFEGDLDSYEYITKGLPKDTLLVVKTNNVVTLTVRFK